MRSRHQEGHIWRKGRAWYGRWWEDVVENGQIVRKQRSKKLADCSDLHRDKKDVKPLLEEILTPLNNGRVNPSSTMTVALFVENCYLPYAKDNCQPSTYSAYATQWNSYLAPRLTKAILRDFRTVDAAKLLAEIHADRGLGGETLRHLKSFLSAAFTYAINQGILNGVNSIRLAQIPRKAAASNETHHVLPDEVLAIMDLLKNAGYAKARAAVALAFFTGLRPGESRGARWEDYDGRQIVVRQSIWGTYTTEPKTAESMKPVPVIEPLRSILAELREADGNPATGPILRGPSGKPLNLDNLVRREIRPTLLAAQMDWHGWYALRRGIATMVNNLEKDPMAAKGLLRHASVITTQRHYIKQVPEVTLNAMKKVEALCNQCATTTPILPA